jgi:protoporphyrin/coproporphyrin ferrochelatase
VSVNQRLGAEQLHDEQPYDSILLVSFGGPEGPDDVLPFMENVTRGRGIPRERLVEVSAHYQMFGGISPINEQNRQLKRAIEVELQLHGHDLPVYWGNRNWDPYLASALETMRADGKKRALAFVTSAFSSYSGCRQYREDIAKAQREVGDEAPLIDKLRVFYNHPGFIEPMIDHAITAIEALQQRGNTPTHLAFTAHSIPMSMAVSSDYVVQLREAARLVAAGASQRAGLELPWELVYQSRSGGPAMPWLEPDICDHLETLHTNGASGVVMIPIGFISDHMEVLYDLDTQALAKAAELQLAVARAKTVGTDSRFVSMIRELIEERIAIASGFAPSRLCVGDRRANHDVCPQDCCPAPQRPVANSSAQRPGRAEGDGLPSGAAGVH